MFDIDLLLLMTGIMLFAWWANYVMGTPFAENPNKVDVGAIMFTIPYTLALRRLKNAGALKDIIKQHAAEMVLTKGAYQRELARSANKRDLYLTGREFFTWERSILCPVCFHFWLSLPIFWTCMCYDCIFVDENVWLAVFYYLANHFIIRKI